VDAFAQLGLAMEELPPSATVRCACAAVLDRPSQCSEAPMHSPSLADHANTVPLEDLIYPIMPMPHFNQSVRMVMPPVAKLHAPHTASRFATQLGDVKHNRHAMMLRRLQMRGQGSLKAGWQPTTDSTPGGTLVGSPSPRSPMTPAQSCDAVPYAANFASAGPKVRLVGACVHCIIGVLLSAWQAAISAAEGPAVLMLQGRSPLSHQRVASSRLSTPVSLAPPTRKLDQATLEANWDAL